MVDAQLAKPILAKIHLFLVSVIQHSCYKAPEAPFKSVTIMPIN